MGIFKHPEPYARELSGQSTIKPFSTIKDLLIHYSKNFKQLSNTLELTIIDDRIDEIIKDNLQSKLNPDIINTYIKLKNTYNKAQDMIKNITTKYNTLYDKQPEIILSYNNGKTNKIDQDKYRNEMKRFEEEIEPDIKEIDNSLDKIIDELILAKNNFENIKDNNKIDEIYKHTKRHKQYIINMLYDKIMYINGKINMIMETQTMNKKYVMNMTYEEIYNKIKNKEMLLFAMIKDTPVFIENYKVRVPYNLMGYFIGEKGRKINKVKKHFNLRIFIEKDERWEVDKSDIEYVMYDIILQKEKYDKATDTITELLMKRKEIEREIEDITME